eukprot:TRINITY_DN2239_c0_g1_i5.p1 TRINITY_DN2239_c0_g1~~TRINITY_DN2239_c0_g1_i5.p1  ORF type:complete len:244 (-),score=26.63 TRINITY_DN2239_c0_g1_i5:137-868(-)
MEDWMDFEKAKVWGFALVPCLPYLLQIRVFFKRGSSEGFSPLVIMLLLIQLVSKIFLILVSSEDMPVFKLQAIVHASFLLGLMGLYHYFERPRYLALIYFGILGVYILSLLLLYNNLGTEVTFIEHIGMIQASCEAAAILPQILLNFYNGSTEGLSTVLILLWIVGDLLKIFIYAEQNFPELMILGPLLSVGLGILLLFQICVYSTCLNKKNKEKEKMQQHCCLLYTSPSPRDLSTSRMPSSA